MTIRETMNTGTAGDRLAALGEHLKSSPALAAPTEEVNSHIHTFYSFSPYSPTLAAFRAREAGLQAAGSIDHDSISAAREMKAACACLGIGSTVGCEVRVSFSGTPYEGFRLNNPDSRNVAYMTIHGVPDDGIETLDAFLNPVRLERERRNRAMVKKLNRVLKTLKLSAIDYDRDVLPLSRSSEGGEVTERHLINALAVSLVGRAGRGSGLVAFLEQDLLMALSKTIRERLLDTGNPHYLYDLIGVLKSSFLERFYIDPDDAECLPVRDVCAFANSIGAIPAYAYLGDISESPTGDKKAEKFEDDYLDTFIPQLKSLGFRAVTYMPPRNTKAQLLKLQSLCVINGLMEISGVDINSSRQSFTCPEVLLPEFRHLIDTTWALVAHEKLSGLNKSYGLFNPKDPFAAESLSECIARYAKIGRGIDRKDPESYVRKHYA